MSSKKNDSDFRSPLESALDIWQKHNRNAALDRSAKATEEAARAKKEQARQAKLDREANDRHRAQMEEMAKAEKEANDHHRAKLEEMAKAEKEANDRHRAEMKEMARKEKEAKEFTKQQQFKLYDISCKIEELSKQDTVLSRIRLFYEIYADFEKIVHDAIEDLKYRKLYTQVEASLRKEENVIIQKYQNDLSSYRKFSGLKMKVEQFNKKSVISTFEELHEAETTFAEIIKLVDESPELEIDTQSLQGSIESFVVGTAKLKWFLELLDSNKIAPTEQRRTLLFFYYGVNEQIILSEEWEHISPIELASEDIEPFCNYAFEYIHRDPSFTNTVLEIMESIDDSAAEQAVERIKGEQQRRIAEERVRKEDEKHREKQYKKMVKQLAAQEDKTNQKDKEIVFTSDCIAVLGIVLVIAGIVCAIKEQILFGGIVIVIGLFVIRVACNYYLRKQKQKNNKQ